jgi:hypothetical protein
MNNGKMHDYDPSWDYAVTKMPPTFLKKAVNRSVKEIRREVLPSLTKYFSNFSVHYANDLNKNHLAFYCSGTHSEPVIVINAKDFKSIAESCADPFDSTPLETAAITTLLHELYHAIQDCEGRLEPNSKKLEKEAEEFAYQYFMYGRILVK